MTITPPLWGVLLGFALVMAVLFWIAERDERRMEREQLEREVLDGLRRRPLPDDELHTDWP